MNEESEIRKEVFKRLFDELSKLHRRRGIDRKTLDVFWEIVKTVEEESESGEIRVLDNLN